MSDWNKTEVITVPKGFYGWRTKGRLRYEDKVFRFPVGQATSLPAPVVEHLRKLIELPEEERPEQPHKYSANSTFTTDADGNPVWSPVDVTALTEEMLTTEAKAELAALCPEVLSDPDVKILYKPGVTEIAANEYKQNTDYDVVYFPNVVTVFGYAFHKSSVRYAIFPKATTVQAGAFNSCENLRYAYFPSLVEALQNSFSSTGIIHADFPALETVGTQYAGNVFGYCTSLVSINMPKLKSISVDGGSHFTGDQKLTNVNLPELECVAVQMFCNCSALTKLDLPKATEVGRYAFEKSGIETLILRSETVATLVHTNAFTGTPIASGTGYIYVPSALIEDYKVATNWSTYAAQFRAIEDYPDICSPTMDEPITKGEATALINSKLEGAGGGYPTFIVETEYANYKHKIITPLSEIREAQRAGKMVVMPVSGLVYNLTDITDDYAIFSKISLSATDKTYAKIMWYQLAGSTTTDGNFILNAT